ncbi:MAG TPA: proline iminopeptidase-family hydrolase [Gemmatimonadaceae bacterium]|nr:proline iminopeptidase-family hydrolase [Gemmatimonadaceae bacterium]
MVTWSLDTLKLALYVIGALCVIYVAFRALRLSSTWGAVFLIGPAVFLGLMHWTGMLIAGVVVLASQVYFVTRSYNWKEFGRIWVYVVLCWAGATYLNARTNGWIPAEWMSRGAAPAATVEQSGAEAASVTEATLPVVGGNIWYRRSGAGSATPVILIHGGPGASSYYLKPLEALGDDRPVIRYDQLGSGHSDAVNDTSLFTIQRFVAELDSLRAALGYDRVHLVGHSWGTMLAFQYYRAHPKRVASLTLASPVISSAAWAKTAGKLVQTLSDSARTAIVEREKTHDYDAPDYLAAVDEYYGKYVMLRPVQEDLDSLTKTLNSTLYRYMWGPSEFSVTGTLRTYDVTRQLRSVKVPTLYTVGEFDEAGPENVRRFAAATPGARLEVIPDAAHLTTWDNPDAMIRVVRDFLRSADSLAAKPAP